MFIKDSKKGAAFYNALILAAIVFIVVLIALMLVKIKKDPKDDSAMRNTLGLKKPKAAIV